MAGAFETITYVGQRDDFLALLENASMEGLPTARQYTLNSDYYAAYFGADFRDLSFCLVKDGRTQAVVLLQQLGPDNASYLGYGAFVYAGVDGRKTAAAIHEAVVRQGQDNGFKTVRMHDPDSAQNLSLLGGYAFNAGGTPTLGLEAVIDLRRREEEIHSDLRQSYKSLVNQGERELSWVFMTKDNVDESLFKEFQDFHEREAGRKTRSDESWQCQLEMIRSGCAELGVGKLDGHGMVSSALFTDHGDVTMYAVAVYKRDLFEMPLAHYNVYSGIMRAKERGQRLFSLGRIFTRDAVSDKEFNIGKFKKGFCSDLQTFIEWNVPVSE